MVYVPVTGTNAATNPPLPQQHAAEEQLELHPPPGPIHLSLHEVVGAGVGAGVGGASMDGHGCGIALPRSLP
jgi:hypothetical protein